MLSLDGGLVQWRIAAAVVFTVVAGCAQASGAEETGAQEKSTPIARGEYLATAANCASCHTTEGGEPFAGGVRFQTEFGAIYSTNITPDQKAGIGAWTEDQFRRAMREGVRADGAHLYPAFPYPSFTRITDQDVSAIWAYLRTLRPSSKPATPNELGFPYNQRWLMGVWNAMYFEPGPYQDDPKKSSQWNRGAYLVEALAHCGACHTPRNRLGAEIPEKALSGAVLLDRVGGDAIRPWFAVNLTRSPDGLKAWSATDIADYLKTGFSARASVHGPMNDVIVASTRHLTQDDIAAIATYLVDLPARSGEAAKPTDAQLSAGSTLYDINCGTCHLPTGLGIKGSSPPLAGDAVVNSADPASLINMILYGAMKPKSADATRHFEKTMDPFDDLEDDEVAAIANFVRGSWGNAARPVTPEDVARQR